MKRYTEILQCKNCYYTRGNSEWYVSKETDNFYCTYGCYLSKEKKIDNG